MFFFLVQSEQGDIFKVTLETDDDMVSNRFIVRNHKPLRDNQQFEIFWPANTFHGPEQNLRIYFV